MKRLVSTLFISIGCISLLLGSFFAIQKSSASRLAFATAPVGVHETAESQATRIVIKSVGVSLPVSEAVIKDNTWEVSTTGVSHLQTSPAPGEKGNSIIYGHNWASLLGSLPQVKPGETITVQYADRKEKLFTVWYTAIVSPSETAIVFPTKDTRLTLYTCTGFLDSKRFVVIAKPEEIKPEGVQKKVSSKTETLSQKTL